MKVEEVECQINNLTKELLVLRDICESLKDNNPKKKSCEEEIKRIESILERIQ